MSDHADIKELIQGLAKKNDGSEFQVQSGTVKSVDWDNRACTVTVDEEYDVPGVRLRSLNDGNKYGCCYKPTVNSVVLIGIIYNKPLNAYVAMFSQVDMISWIDGNGKELFSADLTNGKFVFNGGNNGGLINIQALVEKVNRLENTMNTHQHVAPTGGGPTTANGSQTIAPVTQKSDLEDKNVTH